jgi:hypothetical protein
VHQVNRAGDGTLSYFVHQLGIGLWPVIALAPAAGLAALRRRPTSPAEQVRLLALLWSVSGLVLFTVIETKFHHYILPAVPGLAVLIAMWLDDVLAGRARAAPLALGFGAAIAALVTWDVVSQQERLVELFVYRYDRPWPAGPPWSVDLARELAAFGAAFTLAALALCIPRARGYAAGAVLVSSIAFGYYAMNRYMGAVGPHWGQGQIHATYYRLRAFHGAVLHYDLPSELLADWPAGDRDLELRTFVPDALRTNVPATVTLETTSARITLHAQLVGLGDHRVELHVPAGEVERIRQTIQPGALGPVRRGPAWIEIDADRLITWNLDGRSELFWSSGELWGRSPDTRTDFGYRDDAGLRAYLARPESQGRRFFLLTEATNLGRLRTMLPTQRARDTLRAIDQSSNKFTLLEFHL